MKRGEVWWVDFDPAVGGEIRKRRPAIVVSNDSANRSLNRVQVVPITSNVRRIYPGEALVSLRGEDRKAMAHQLMTVSKMRITDRIDTLAEDDLDQVEGAIRTQLGLVS